MTLKDLLKEAGEAGIEDYPDDYCFKCGEPITRGNPVYQIFDGCLGRVCPHGCKKDQRWNLTFKMTPWNVG